MKPIASRTGNHEPMSIWMSAASTTPARYLSVWGPTSDRRAQRWLPSLRTDSASADSASCREL